MEINVTTGMLQSYFYVAMLHLWAIKYLQTMATDSNNLVLTD